MSVGAGPLEDPTLPGSGASIPRCSPASLSCSRASSLCSGPHQSARNCARINGAGEAVGSGREVNRVMRATTVHAASRGLLADTPRKQHNAIASLCHVRLGGPSTPRRHLSPRSDARRCRYKVTEERRAAIREVRDAIVLTMTMAEDDREHGSDDYSRRTAIDAANRAYAIGQEIDDDETRASHRRMEAAMGRSGKRLDQKGHRWRLGRQPGQAARLPATGMGQPTFGSGAAEDRLGEALRANRIPPKQ